MKWCPTPRFLAVVTAALLIALFAVSGYAQFQTGNIYGRVQAKDGSVLPGVTVTLTGIGAPQTAVTDAQGNFRFINLSPGTYTLKAELAGYGTATRAGLSVRVAQNADVTMTLNPSVSESITVTAEAPLLDVRKAGDGINVSKVELEKIPTSRDPWTVLQQAPGVQVDRLNVGGNQSGQQSYYLGKGADSGQNTWNMDGVNITDMAATGSTPLYFDFDSFEEMQITTGGSDPRIMTPGVQLNMVTKRGTNDLRGSGRYYYTPGKYQTKPTVPAEAASYLVQANAINYVRDFGGELGGPIWRDHIWGWVATAENLISNQAAVGLTSSGATTGGSFDNIILRDKNAKLNGQITASNSAVGFYTFGDKVRNARGLSFFVPFEAATHQSGPTKVYKLEDTQIIGSSLYLTGMWSKVTGGFKLLPNGGIGPTAPIPFRDLGNVWHGTRSFYITERPQKQYRLDGSKFFDIGTMNHELKFGFGYRDTPTTSISGYPSPIQGFVRARNNSFCAAGAGCVSVFLDRETNLAYGQKYRDIYAGDTILIGNLTLQAGLRWDNQTTQNLASTAGANPFLASLATPLVLPGPCTGGTCTVSLPAQTYGGDPRDLKWRTVEPRLGLTYSLGGDKKTLLRASYNRYANQVGSVISNISPLGLGYWVLAGNVADNTVPVTNPSQIHFQKVIGFAGFDPSNPAAIGASTTRFDYGAKVPSTDEAILGFDHEVVSDFSIGFNYTFRYYRNLLETRAEKTQGGNDFYTSADYVQITPEPNGTPVYDLKPGVDTPTFFVIRNRPDYHQTYNSFEFVATKRLSHRWMLRGNLSYADWKEHSGANSFDDPTRRLTAAFTCGGNCNGLPLNGAGNGSGAFADVFPSAKWTSNITGLYQLPLDFSLGASLTARQGYPYVRFDEVTTNSSSGATDVILDSPGSLRFANVYELDLRAAKDFRFFNRVGVTLSADVFNAPNKRTILQRAGLVANNGTITEIQSPRVWRFGARLSF
jgi:hypothetical protein